MKKYDNLPVVIEEDHNDVLPHVYRAIGSKHLPIKDVTMLHFDSHPDMCLSLDMPADTVFNKYELFESLSIENWILPAVYAGHINNVIWVKPPWCSQVVDKTLQFFVGKCTKTGTLRTTCTESYFLSEGLYVPEVQLENKKHLTFTVITLCPHNWEELTDTVSPSTETDEHHLNEASKRCQTEYAVSNKKAKLDIQQVNSTSNSTDERTIPENCNSKIDNKVTNIVSNGNTDSDNAHLRFPTSEQISQVCKALEGQYYVLDIDLDFFSTRNPFREMFGDQQYDILKELYKFTKPAGNDMKALDECVSLRMKQLAELKDVFLTLQNDENSEILHPRKDLITKLIKEVKSFIPGDLDYSLLHDGGCTCDDTELPHHVSSQSQISSLTDCVQELLSHLPSPTLVTVARSSLDDFCPADQVDTIQAGVVDILQELYLKIALNLAYQVESDNEESGK